MTNTIVWAAVAYWLLPVPPLVFWGFAGVLLVLLWIHASTGMSLRYEYIHYMRFGIEADFRRRKTAVATWGPSTSGEIYAKLSVDMTKALAFIEQKRSQTGSRITITHLVGKAVALALQKAEGLNGRILLGRFIKNKTVDICFLVSLEGGKNLAPKTINNIDK